MSPTYVLGFTLAKTGFRDGKKCSTHWAYIKEFIERYPSAEAEDGAIISEHGNIYSSGGASSLWNLILYLLEKFVTKAELTFAVVSNVDVATDSRLPNT